MRSPLYEFCAVQMIDAIRWVRPLSLCFIPGDASLICTHAVYTKNTHLHEQHDTKSHKLLCICSTFSQLSSY